jgi:hypothetical protein
MTLFNYEKLLKFKILLKSSLRLLQIEETFGCDVQNCIRLPDGDMVAVQVTVIAV